MKNILIPIFVVVISVCAYYLYQNYQKSEIVDIWKYIPENSSLVYESDGLTSLIDATDSITFFDKIFQIGLNITDSDTSSFFKNTGSIKSLTSIHVTGNESIDLLFVFDISNSKESEYLKNEIEKLKNIKEYNYLKRVYREIDINEISNDRNSFSYVKTGNVFIISRTSYLVEDAIRTLLDDEMKSLKDTKSELFELSKLKNDNGNLYVNGSKIADLVSVFINNEFSKQILKSVFYDLNIDNQKLLLNGFGFSKDKSVLRKFEDQTPSEVKVFEYIPNTASYLYHIGFSNPEIWQSNSEDTIKLERLSKWIGNEVAIYEMNKQVDGVNEKVVLISTQDINEALNHLNILAEQSMRLESDSIYVEHYGGYEIKELEVKEFPQQLFGEMFEGFDQSFYFVMNDYMVLSNSVYAIKMLINSIEEEDTWGRSIEKNKFLESTLKEANISLYVNFNTFWDKFLEQLDDKWRGIFVKMELQNTISNGAIQFSNVGDKFYSSAVVSFNNKEVKKGSFDVERETYFDSKLITKPMIVRNHNDNSFEVLVQDSLSQIYLVDSNGDVLWKDSIGDYIIGRVHQIDYYKNRKLQYFFATENTVHLIDRKGNYVEGFPRSLSIDIQTLSVIDYDNSKNYRFAIDNGKGGIYTYDKNFTNLDGWKPRKVEGVLSEPLKHIRVRGSDYLIALQKNGQINVMNRRGEIIDGFPLKLEVEISGESFLSVGANAKSTKLTVISTEGELISFNLIGDVLDRKEFYKTTKETKFRIAIGSSKKKFIVYRYNNRRLAVLDDNGNEIFEKDYLDANISNVQFYDLGTGNEIYAVNDVNQSFTYIYNHTGEMINFTPLNSSFDIGLLDYSSRLNKRMLYVNYQSNLSVYSY